MMGKWPIPMPFLQPYHHLPPLQKAKTVDETSLKEYFTPLIFYKDTKDHNDMTIGVSFPTWSNRS